LFPARGSFVLCCPKKRIQTVSFFGAALKFSPAHRADFADMIKHPYLLSFYHPAHVEACEEASSGTEEMTEAEHVL
jgi:hypothetical protein